MRCRQNTPRPRLLQRCSNATQTLISIRCCARSTDTLNRAPISPDGQAAFPHATIHAAKADACHWLDSDRAATATGVQQLVRCTDVHTINLSGHTPGHTGYLFGEGVNTVLFWGDTVHSHAVQLRRRSVSTAADSDEHAAIRARRKAFDLASSNRWWVGAAHLPFPGLGHLRRDRYGYSFFSAACSRWSTAIIHSG